MDAFNPYAPPQAGLEPAEPSVDGSPCVLADRGTRLGANILDGLISGLPAGLVVFGGLSYLTMKESWQPPQSLLGNVALSVAGALFGSLVYLAVNGVLLHRHGQSVGKRICRIKIIKPDGSVPSLFDSFFRRLVLVQVVTQVPFAGPLIGLVDALLIFRKSQRCLHDDVAGTLVVKA